MRSRFNLSRAEQTRRILNALANPRVTMLAHPSGRLIGEREAYDVDMLQVLRKAKAMGAQLELNAHPERLDLTDTWCRMCKDEGVLVASNAVRTAPSPPCCRPGPAISPDSGAR